MKWMAALAVSGLLLHAEAALAQTRSVSAVRHWQLGQEDDESFVGMSNQNLSRTIARVKSEFDRLGRDTRIGVHWNWETPSPKRVTCREDARVRIGEPPTTSAASIRIELLPMSIAA